jgi:FkbM family methyltransferase
MKQRVKRAASRLGYEVRRAGTQATWKTVFERMKRFGLDPGTVIDVGVAEGTPFLHQAFPAAHLFLVEPLTEYEPDLRRLIANRRGSYVLAAATTEDGTALMNVRTGDDRRVMEGSSLFTDQEDIPSEAREVRTVRLDTVCRELPRPFLLKADVQGAELDVVNGALGILPETDLVILEVSFFPFYDGAPEFADVVAAMRSLSFVVYDLIGGHGRPVDGALAQIDVAFVHEHGRFRKDPRRATPR